MPGVKSAPISAQMGSRITPDIELGGFSDGRYCMTKHYIGHEFEALKLRYEDQVQLLRTLTEIDHRLVTALFTLQLALGAWLATQATVAPRLQWGLAVIDLAIAAIFVKLLFNNNRRRQEVAATIANVNAALGFLEPGVYLEGKALNPEYVRRYWFAWYVVAVFVSTVGVLLVLIR